MSDVSTEELLHTPLYALHSAMGAKMVPFAGYSMPIQYPMGIIKEHVHTRTLAGLFDVSHMGQVWVSPQPQKTMADVAHAFEKIVPVDICDLPLNRQRYALFTNEVGGILDDLMIARMVDGFFVVVNAACKKEDLVHLRKHLSDVCDVVEWQDRALLALQGPRAAFVMEQLLPEVAGMLFMDTKKITWAGHTCLISRSGYTGEDGFEISLPNEAAIPFAQALLNQPDVACIGLGARDSLRLEAGLCLYGHDMNTRTTPIEASLGWALSKIRRVGGARAGGYLGAAAIEQQLLKGVTEQRVGLQVLDKIPVREGAELVDESGQKIGYVTSGGFGPTVAAPIAMGYVSTAYSAPGTRLQAIVRGKPIAVEVVKTPFVAQRYYRG